jgi:hypothetical protein
MTDPADPPVRALAELVARIAQTLSAGPTNNDAAARTQVAADLAQLQAILAETERSPEHRAKRAPGSPTGFDLAQVAAALRVFAEWLRTPTPANEASAERAMTDLQATMGPLIGWDPAREDAARRAQYRREARAALDEIFRDKPDKP